MIVLFKNSFLMIAINGVIFWNFLTFLSPCLLLIFCLVDPLEKVFPTQWGAGVKTIDCNHISSILDNLTLSS